MTPGNEQIYTSPGLFLAQHGNIPALPLPTSSLLAVAQEPAWSCPPGKIWAAGASQIIPEIQSLGAGQSSRMLPCSIYPFCCWARSNFGGRAGFGAVLGGYFCLASLSRATGKRSRNVVDFSPHHPWVDLAGTAPCDPVQQFSQDTKLSPAPSLKGAVIPGKKTRKIHSAWCFALSFPISLVSPIPEPSSGRAQPQCLRHKGQSRP